MALKDHLIDSAKVSEQEIEAIIDGRAKYDAQTRTIVLFAQNLTLKAKILLYLAALKGWKFVVDGPDIPSEEASPKEIMDTTGILDNSLRPTLSDLVSMGLVINRNGRYEIAQHGLAKSRSLIIGEVAPMKPAAPVTPDAAKIVAPKQKQKASRRASGWARPKLAPSFKQLVENGWFKQPRTIADLKIELDRQTVNPKVTDLSGHLLAAYRRGELTRTREKQGAKLVYVYTQP